MNLIADDDFDLQVAKSEEDKKLAANARWSKTWRVLRITSKNKLKRFEHIENGNNLQSLFEAEPEVVNETPPQLPQGVAVK